MKYRKLFDWIDGDDACEATAVTLQSAHDPSHDGEQDFIIRRVKSLIETGATIQHITLEVWINEGGFPERISYKMAPGDIDLHDIDAFAKVVKGIYECGESIETMTIEVDIREVFESIV